jgi:hypothetical protein
MTYYKRRINFLFVVSKQITTLKINMQIRCEYSYRFGVDFPFLHVRCVVIPEDTTKVYSHFFYVITSYAIKK